MPVITISIDDKPPQSREDQFEGSQEVTGCCGNDAVVKDSSPEPSIVIATALAHAAFWLREAAKLADYADDICEIADGAAELSTVYLTQVDS